MKSRSSGLDNKMVMNFHLCSSDTHGNVPQHMKTVKTQGLPRPSHCKMTMSTCDTAKNSAEQSTSRIG